jgi:GTP-binding protein
VQKRTQDEIVSHVAAHPTLILTSSEKGIGIPELRAEILQLANPE